MGAWRPGAARSVLTLARHLIWWEPRNEAGEAGGSQDGKDFECPGICTCSVSHRSLPGVASSEVL